MESSTSTYQPVDTTATNATVAPIAPVSPVQPITLSTGPANSTPPSTTSHSATLPLTTPPSTVPSRPTAPPAASSSTMSGPNSTFSSISTSHNSNANTTPSTPSTPNRRRLLMLGGAVVLLIVVILAVTWWWRSNQSTSDRLIPRTGQNNIGSVVVDVEPLSEQQLLAAAANNPVRTKPSLIFVNAAPVQPSQRIQVALMRGSVEVMRRGGFGGPMAVEMVAEEGPLVLVVEDTAAKKQLLTTTLAFAPNSATIVIRQDNGTPEGEFIVQENSFAQLPVASVYNLSSKPITIFGGSLRQYNVNKVLESNASASLDLASPTNVVFGLTSEFAELSSKLFNMPNPDRLKLLFFVLENQGKASVTSLFLAVPEEARATLPEIAGDASVEAWCEGQWSCRLAQPGCGDAECGKVCLPTPDACQATANGGAGGDWNGQKVDRPTSEAL